MAGHAVTVMAAEAGAGAAEAGAADASAGGATAMQSPRPAPPRSGGRTSQGSRGGGPRPRTGGRTQQATQRTRTVAAPSTRTVRVPSSPRPSGSGQSNAQPRRPATRAQGPRRQAAPPRRPAASGGGAVSYQGVILAEFVAAILLVAATPFAKKSSEGISPYAASDMVQLLAIGLVYFLLALLSGMSHGAGRVSAWFGALILLTVGLGEAARLAKLFNVFGLTSGGTATSGGAGSDGTSQAPGTDTAGGRG